MTVRIGLAGRSDHFLFLSRLQSIVLVYSKDGKHPACAGGQWHLQEPLVTPAQSPGCARSGCAESALFQGLILNLCFSHPPQALSRLGLFFYYFFFVSASSQSSALLFRLTKYLTSASTSPYAALAEETRCVSPTRSLLLISLPLKHLAPCRALFFSSVRAVQRETNPSGRGCVAIGSQRVQAQRAPSQGGLTSRSVYPDNHLDP